MTTSAKRAAFVKSATTSVSVGRSQAELERILRRYGATGFGTSHDYAEFRASVFFRVPDTPGGTMVPVRLEVNIRTVYDTFYGRPTRRRWSSADQVVVTEWWPAGYDAKKLAHAERVAWRQLVLWVDAACSAAAAGVQKMSETFLAHTLVTDESGTVRRMVDHLDRAAGGDWRALLPASTGGDV